MQDAKFACGTIAWAAIQNPSAVKEQLGVDGSLPQAGGTVKKGIILPGSIIFFSQKIEKNPSYWKLTTIFVVVKMVFDADCG